MYLIYIHDDFWGIQINGILRNTVELKIPRNKKIIPELKTLEWNILNPDRLINLEINNMRRTSII